jgi:acyl transferase domain-containing protein/acyl carrier protein
LEDCYKMTEQATNNTYTGLEIAIIGMAGRFPGASNIEEYWENLKNGVESISFFTDEELEDAGIDPELIKKPNYVKARGAMKDTDAFDSSFFDYYPMEAQVMLPQTRIFHEVAWEALENAGYNPDTYEGLIGLYGGASSAFNWEIFSFLNGANQVIGEFSTYILSESEFMNTRISYKLNLKGPSMTIQSACSTSLVAVHQACRALLTGECHIAMAGGVTVRIPAKTGYLFQEGMIGSPDGHCRAFDADAKGTIGGDGAGMAVLKRLDMAMAHGDKIHAVIKGSALNNDGNRKVGYTAPSIEGQAQVIKAAQQMAEVNPETITYIEAHGTGTTLGDPIEIQALTKAFNTEKKQYCAIGSAKTNVGHLDAAAGIAGLIKTAMALKHKQIPPSLHYKKPNPKIDFSNSPFFVNASLKEWQNNGHPLRAGISSFGIGGTNAHVLLEEAPPEKPSEAGKKWNIMLLSAHTDTALNRMTENLSQFLEKNQGLNINDAAYTLQVGRKEMEHRRFVVGSDAQDIIAELDPETGNQATYKVQKKNMPVIFMFPGQGSQYTGMGAGMYETEPVFRQEMDRCFEILTSLMEYDIKELIYPTGSQDSLPGDQPQDINQTEVAQPLIFAYEYAMAKQLMNWGIKPYAMIGHSIGEYVAAHLSGVLSLEDALKIVARRGKLMQSLPPGSMLSVSLPQEELKPFMDEKLSLAAVNGPSLCVVSGTEEDIDNLAETLTEKGHRIRKLHTSHAFHSTMMDPILEDFHGFLKGITFNKPETPYLSNITGNWITVEDAMAPSYWVNHIRATVNFYDGLDKIFKEKYAILAEIGPGNVLSTFARLNPSREENHHVVNFARHPGEEIDDTRYMYSKLGQLWLYGQTIDWKNVYGEEKRRRTPLPSYPFERQRYWVDSSMQSIDEKLGSEIISTRKKDNIADWFYIPVWEKSYRRLEKTVHNSSDNNTEQKNNNRWLVFNHRQSLAEQLVDSLKQKGYAVFTVNPGERYATTEENGYTINPKNEQDYEALFEALEKEEFHPHHILHLWGIDNPHSHDNTHDNTSEEIRNQGFYSLLNIAGEMGKRGFTSDLKLTVITNDMQEVLGTETLIPQKATLIGAVKGIPMEFPNIDARSIDIQLPEPGTPAEEKLIRNLETELTGETKDNIKDNSKDNIIAYRGNHRWIQVLKPVQIEAPQNNFSLRQEGVYLVTGGLGGIGLTLARHLAATVKARLVLIGQSEFPRRDQWENWLETRGPQDKISRKILLVKNMEEMGAEVMVISADVADMQQMQNALGTVKQTYPKINGLIHAAGVPDGALIQRRTRQLSEKVFHAKVEGTKVLDTLLQDQSLDFILLCSSLNSITPTLGQTAYIGANAYLDAYAHQKNIEGTIPTIAVNWDAWQDVGMAAEAARKRNGTPEPVTHPLYNQCRRYGTMEIYNGKIDSANHWVLNEHRILGKSTLPGTAYLEMVRAAFEDTAQGKTIEIADMYLLKPMIVEDGSVREISTIIKQLNDDYEFSIVSRPEPGKDSWMEHAKGKISICQADIDKKQDIQQLKSQCSQREEIVTREERNREESAIRFGPRWLDCSKKTYYGEQQRLISLKPAEDFLEDLVFYQLHPAFLDTMLSALAVQGTAFLPFSYKRVTIKKALTPVMYSHIREVDRRSTGENFQKYDATIMDENGDQLVDIEGYTLLAVTKEKVDTTNAPTTVTNNGLPFQDYAPTAKKQEENLLKNGITQEEGIEIFNRLINSAVPQVIVSTINLKARLEQLEKLKSSIAEKNDSIQQKAGPKIARPQLSSTYVKPRNDIELKTAAVWENALGVEGIGINDNFFELGANSLMMVQVGNQLEKALAKKFPVVTLYTYPTVRLFCEYVSQETQDAGLTEKETERKKEKSQWGKKKLQERKMRRRGVRNE